MSLLTILGYIVGSSTLMAIGIAGLTVMVITAVVVAIIVERRQR